MLMYAIGILPLITRLKRPGMYKQNWYADDSACAGSLQNVKEWLIVLMKLGPSYGYYAEPTKSTIIVKEEHLEKAKQLFAEFEVNVVQSSRFLGGCIGNRDGIRNFVKNKVEEWVHCTEKLAAAAKSYPQSAYSAFVHSLSCEWSFLQRVIGENDFDYLPLREVIQNVLTPAILGREILEKEHRIFELPAKLGGLAISDPVKAASGSYSTSKEATKILQNAIKTDGIVDLSIHYTHFTTTVTNAAKQKEVDQIELSSEILDDLPAAQRRTLKRIIQGNASGWLTVIPLREENFDLSATEFRDQLAIRYHHEPLGLPAECDGCGASFSLQHSLDCAKGGLVKKGHNDVRDHDARLADIAWGGATIEPILVPEDDIQGRRMLHADWMVRGVWEANRVAFFDNRIIHADAPSYKNANLSWNATANRAAAEKKKKYSNAAEEVRASFTPLICSTDGAVHQEYGAYHKRLACRLSIKWQRPYSVMIGWVRVQSQFSIIRAVSMRIRGTRRRIQGLYLHDGAAIGVGQGF